MPGSLKLCYKLCVSELTPQIFGVYVEWPNVTLGVCCAVHIVTQHSLLRTVNYSAFCVVGGQKIWSVLLEWLHLNFSSLNSGSHMESEGKGDGAGWDGTYTQIPSPAALAAVSTERMTVLYFSPSRATVILWKHNCLTGYVVKKGCVNSSCNCSKVLQGETNPINRLYILSGSWSWPKLHYRAHSKYCYANASRAGNLNKNGK